MKYFARAKLFTPYSEIGKNIQRKSLLFIFIEFEIIMHICQGAVEFMCVKEEFKNWIVSCVFRQIKQVATTRYKNF